MSDYPKFQISKFLDDKRDYQIVVRCDTYEELQEAMKEVKPLIQTMEKAKPKAEGPDVMMDQLPKVINCPDHGDKMFLREGKYGPYYSHKHGDDWCNLDAKKYLKG